MAAQARRKRLVAKQEERIGFAGLPSASEQSEAKIVSIDLLSLSSQSCFQFIIWRCIFLIRRLLFCDLNLAVAQAQACKKHIQL